VGNSARDAAVSPSLMCCRGRARRGQAAKLGKRVASRTRRSAPRASLVRRRDAKDPYALWLRSMQILSLGRIR